MSCLNTAPVLVCFTAADGTKLTIIEHVVYENGVPIGQGFSTADDTETPFDITGGTVTAGACPIPSPDVEWSEMCDVQTDGSSIPFMCQTITSFDEKCLPIIPSLVTNYEMDKQTAYVPTGTIGVCPDCQPVGSLGTITDWSVLA